MNLKEFNTNTKLVTLEFNKGEFEKFNVQGDYALFDNNESIKHMKLVKRGKSESTNYLLIDSDVKKFISKRKGLLKAQVIRNRYNHFLIVDLGKVKV